MACHLPRPSTDLPWPSIRWERIIEPTSSHDLPRYPRLQPPPVSPPPISPDLRWEPILEPTAAGVTLCYSSDGAELKVSAPAPIELNLSHALLRDLMDAAPKVNELRWTNPRLLSPSLAFLHLPSSSLTSAHLRSPSLTFRHLLSTHLTFAHLLSVGGAQEDAQAGRPSRRAPRQPGPIQSPPELPRSFQSAPLSPRTRHTPSRPLHLPLSSPDRRTPRPPGPLGAGGAHGGAADRPRARAHRYVVSVRGLDAPSRAPC